MDEFVAEVVAALFTWGVLLLGAATALMVAYWLGYRRGRFVEDVEQKRARVLAAAEQAAAETVAIPAQRQASR